ncbi:TolC family protein [Rhodohalobacter sulfatireducens]|uniref:TolC family protein n=1 Tax=Rhodohalobacter sulfatireducens TaxID=2911366 RepID=A0ABS9KD24_9BACT|nr:TolC family protein [Rhodohalobacter sulfatireducens]MCG2588738.1 TolC family protein [Rhodohalobacter sulfatireducens]MDR9409482.1 TolC family protein [Balneolaceae bacterium]
MKRIFYLLTCFLIVPLVSFAQTERITLQQAVDLALENNYQLKQAENNLNLAENDIKSEYADFLPSVSGNLNGSRTAGQQFIFDRFSEGLDPFVDVTSQSVSGRVGADVTLFDGFNNILTLRASQQSKISSEESLRRARENVIFNTASRYLQVLLDMQLLEIAQENLVTSQRQLEQIEAQVEVGSLPTVDLFNQEAQVANDELSVTQRNNALNMSKLLLIRQLQIDPQRQYEFVVPDLPDQQDVSMLSMYDLNDLVDQAMMNRADIKSEEADINNLRYQLKITKGSLYPSISASAGLSSRYSDQYSLAGEDVPFDDQFFDQQVNRSLGLSVSIPIFQNWNRMNNIQSAKVQLKNAQLSLDNTKLQVIQEVTQAFNDYDSYMQEFNAAEKSLIASEKAFETQQERYNVGASTLIELSEAQSSYVEAQSNYTQSRYNLIFQEKLLDYYLGQFTGEDVEF